MTPTKGPSTGKGKKTHCAGDTISGMIVAGLILATFSVRARQFLPQISINHYEMYRGKAMNTKANSRKRD